MITIEVYAIRDNGGRGHGVDTLWATPGAVPRVGDTIRVTNHAVPYWAVEHVVWERLTSHPLVELWARPL